MCDSTGNIFVKSNVSMDSAIGYHKTKMQRWFYVEFIGKNAIFLVFLTPIVRVDRRKIKQNW